MQLRITRHEHKPHLIAYTRDDGSVTWMQSDDYFVRHDLSHYAIEQTLGYNDAFFGMLNAGMDIRDFEDRQKRMEIGLSAEAAYAENMANLFLAETVHGNFDDFNEVQSASLQTSFGTRFPVVPLEPDQIRQIRTLLRKLLQQWSDLPAGESITLTFGI